MVIFLVGNKLDVVEKNFIKRKVKYETAKKLADEHGFLFEETSALNGKNVNNVFDQLLEGKALR